MSLNNDAKIRFCNAYDEITQHKQGCNDCAIYLAAGDGDLCDNGKDIIAKHLAYTETEPKMEAMSLSTKINPAAD